MGNNQKYKLAVALFFYIPAEQECISTREVRALLGIEDDILRGLGMCLQQAKRARVRTGALLANLRNNNGVRVVKRQIAYLPHNAV